MVYFFLILDSCDIINDRKDDYLWMKKILKMQKMI